MLTEKEIQTKALELVAMGEAPLWGGGFVNGATWANETISAQIAELLAVNSEQASKIVDLQTRRDEHLRTIADLMGEKAELTTALNSALNIIRANGLHTEAHAKFFVAATDVVEKHTAK